MELSNIIHEEINAFNYKTAVIEILKPVSGMSIDNYIQAIPEHTLRDRLLYVNRGASGYINISPKNVKVLKIFNANDTNAINQYIQNKRKELNHTNDLNEGTNLLKNPKFNKWFKNSKIVNSDGTPQVVYHETSEENAENILKTSFDINRLGARASDTIMPNGFFFKPTNTQIGVSPNSTQMGVYLSIQNPFLVKDRKDLHEKLVQKSPDFKKLNDYFDLKEKQLSDGVDDDFKRIKLIKNREEKTIELNKLQTVISDWGDWYNKTTDKIRDLVRKTLINSGYDGLMMENDEGSRNRTVTTIIAFHPNQIKSINNNGEFSLTDNNIMKENTDNKYNDINDIYRYETIHGWITPDYNFIRVPFGGHEFMASELPTHGRADGLGFGGRRLT